MTDHPRPPRRVLFVHQSPDLYGSDRVLLEIAAALVAAGDEAIVLLPGDGPLVPALRARGVEVHSMDPLEVLKLSRAVMNPRGACRLAASARASRAAIDARVAGRKIDLVHSNTLAVLGGALWARARCVPHVWHVHEIVEHPRVASLAFPWLVHALAGAVICNSHATRQWLVSRQPRLARRAQVIWNGVHACGANAAGDTVLHERFRPDGTRIAVGLVGRINRMKGHHLLLDAAERLAAQGMHDFSLVFVGNPPPGQHGYLDELQARTSASPMARRVVFTGFLPEPAEAFAALDIVCAPSTEAEAFGLVAAEAMAAGRPVVAARIGGLPEVVDDGHTGLLHAPGDAAALAAALGSLLADAARRAAFGDAGRARFAREFSVARMNGRVLSLFASLT